jgi:hypothetical protein
MDGSFLGGRDRIDACMLAAIRAWQKRRNAHIVDT